MEIIAKDFGKQYTNYSGLLSMHAWVWLFQTRVQILLSDLDVDACIFKENETIVTLNKTF